MTKDSQSTLELLRYILANWVKEQERIDAERAEAEASFKYKTFDMGDRADSISPGITFLQASISQDVLFRQTSKGKNKSGEIE